MMATEAMAAASAASTTSSVGSSLGMSNGGATNGSTVGKIENKMLPSFSDILWCPDIDGDVMSNPVMGQAILPDPLSTDEPGLDDIAHMDFSSDLACGMVSNPSVAQPVKQISTSETTSTSNHASDMPSDISDLRSSDLLQNLSGVDIDRMFEELSESNSLSYGNNNNNNGDQNGSKNQSSTSRKVIITRKPSISDSSKEENNNHYTDLSDLKNNNNNSVTVYSENGSSSRCFEFQATVGPNGSVPCNLWGPKRSNVICHPRLILSFSHFLKVRKCFD